MKRSTTFILAVILSLALMYFSYLPAVGILGHVLLLFSTLTHEMGHGLMAMLVGGDFKSLVINWDGSGVTSWSGGTGRICLLYTSPSPRDRTRSRMPSSA